MEPQKPEYEEQPGMEPAPTSEPESSTESTDAGAVNSEAPTTSEAPEKVAPVASDAPEAPAMESSAKPEAEVKDVTEHPIDKKPVEKDNPFVTIVQFVVKPVTVLREKLSQYDNAKNAGILAGIALVFSVLLSILTLIVGTITDYTCRSFDSCGVKIDFGRFSRLKGYFGDFLFGNIVSTIVVMMVVTGIFFGIAKLLKSQKASFWRMLSVVSLAMIPLVLTGALGAIMQNFFFSDFMQIVATFIILIGMLYAAIVFYEGMSAGAELEGDKKVYFVLLASAATWVTLAILVWLIGDKIGLDDFLSIIEI